MKDQRTDQELNRIIAEWRGVVAKQEEDGGFWYLWCGKIKIGVGSGLSSDHAWAVFCPRYCTDLNAIHEAVQHLFKNQPGVWERQWFPMLHDVVTGIDPIENDWDMVSSDTCRRTTEATARQRAEALVAIIESQKV